MTENQFNAIKIFRKEYRAMCDEWARFSDVLVSLQKLAAQKDTPPYPIETPVVYNRALEQITKDDKIKIIVVGDNPGKDEQLEKNNRYLVGQSGKIAQGFFSRHPSLECDFRKNAIILNKTPVHTAKTSHLKFLAKKSPVVADLILKSQIWLAQKTALLAKGLGAQIWLVGYAELKERGIFLPYRDALKKAYEVNGKEGRQREDAWENVLVFQHFSMNRFLVDLRTFCGLKKTDAFDEETLPQKISALGRIHREEIFG